MQTILSTHVDEQQSKHPPSSHNRTASAQRVSLADRVALHLGLALVTWSRRPRVVAATPNRDELRARQALAIARVDREWGAERALLLTLPRR